MRYTPIRTASQRAYQLGGFAFIIAGLLVPDILFLTRMGAVGMGFALWFFAVSEDPEDPPGLPHPFFSIAGVAVIIASAEWAARQVILMEVEGNDAISDMAAVGGSLLWFWVGCVLLAISSIGDADRRAWKTERARVEAAARRAAEQAKAAAERAERERTERRRVAEIHRRARRLKRARAA